MSYFGALYVEHDPLSQPGFCYEGERRFLVFDVLEHMALGLGVHEASRVNGKETRVLGCFRILIMLTVTTILVLYISISLVPA